jgi:hypothetical protein
MSGIYICFYVRERSDAKHGKVLPGRTFAAHALGTEYNANLKIQVCVAKTPAKKCIEFLRPLIIKFGGRIT